MEWMRMTQPNNMVVDSNYQGYSLLRLNINSNNLLYIIYYFFISTNLFYFRFPMFKTNIRNQINLENKDKIKIKLFYLRRYL